MILQELKYMIVILLKRINIVVNLCASGRIISSIKVSLALKFIDRGKCLIRALTININFFILIHVLASPL